MRRALLGLHFTACVVMAGAVYSQNSTWCGQRIEGLSAVMPGVRLALFAACVKLPPEDIFYG